MRNQEVSVDTESKRWWLEHGENLEHRFVDVMGDIKPGFRISINDKKAKDPTAPDMVIGTANVVADLKCQRTPFFTAKKYNMDPRFTFTLNSKDVFRYRELYPELKMFIWVDWQQTNLTWKQSTYEVEPYAAIYQIPFRTISMKISKGEYPLHEYIRRPKSTSGNHPLKGHVDSRGNASASYLVDLRHYEPIWQFG